MNAWKKIGLIVLGGAVTAACAADGIDETTQAATGPGRYIVEFNDVNRGKSAVANVGGVLELDLPSHAAAAFTLPGNAVAGLSRNPHIASIEVDHKRFLDGLYDNVEVEPYGIGAVQADIAAQPAAASAKKLCIIDSGYDRGHPDLPTANVDGTSDPGTGDWFTDENSHGTHVAGTISAVGNNNKGVVGVVNNGNLNVHIIKVFGAEGWAYSSGLAAAIDECAAVGSDIVSMSLGSSQKNRFEQTAIRGHYNNGILFIAAAGNDGNTRHHYPASYPEVVSVAAVDDTLTVAGFSQQTNQVELSGPGVHVLSTVPRGMGSFADVVAGGTQYSADAMDGSPNDSATGTLVDCGLGTSACAGASGAICLIQRGDIAFSDKVLACEAGGGAGAIIYNNEPGALLGTLGEVATTIPSVGVSDTDGAALLGELGNSVTVSVGSDDYAFFDGTSMATPHVAAVAALVWEAFPGLSNIDIRDALGASALDLGSAGRDNAYGHGLVQTQDAIDYINNGPPPGPDCSDDGECNTECGAGEDPDCSSGGGTCELSPKGASCVSNGECCSNSCKGKPGDKTCK